MIRFFYVLAILGVVIGAYVIAFAIKPDYNAIQSVNLVAVGLAFAILPYILARSVDAIANAKTARLVRDYLERRDPPQ